MTEKERRILNRIPKKYRNHIINLVISKSGDCNVQGRELLNYTVTYDNGDEHVYQNQYYMFWHIREYTNAEEYIEG